MKNILLIHGWDYENYYGHINHSAWDNRSKFINELAIDNKVYYMDLPGFGLRKEPYAKVWTLDDYAKFINNYIKINNLNIDYILGYSFGGAVALQYKKNYNMHIKEILVSPALVRNEVKSKKFFSTPKIMDSLRCALRNFYLIYFIKNEEMVNGTNFLKNTYQNIVRVNMLSELLTMPLEDFLIIYGSEDNMVNPDLVLSTVNNELRERIKVIQGGSHDIANTHTKKLVKIINEEINRNFKKGR